MTEEQRIAIKAAISTLKTAVVAAGGQISNFNVGVGMVGGQPLTEIRINFPDGAGYESFAFPTSELS